MLWFSTLTAGDRISSHKDTVNISRQLVVVQQFQLLIRRTVCRFYCIGGRDTVPWRNTMTSLIAFADQAT